jgi:hypothetical protein
MWYAFHGPGFVVVQPSAGGPLGEKSGGGFGGLLGG